MSQQPAAGLRVHASRDENEALKAQGRTLMGCAKLAVMTNLPAEALEQMGPQGIAGSALQVALTAVLKAPDALALPTFEVVGFSIGLAFGEILRHATALDLGSVMERLGEGIGHAMEHGRPQPTSGVMN